MNSIRDLISIVQTLLEDGPSEAPPGAPAAPAAGAPRPDPANPPVKGALSGQDLARLLPGVRSVPNFNSAIAKVLAGQAGALSNNEQKEMAGAFASLIQIPAAQKSKVLLMMMPVAAAQAAPKPTPGAAPAQPAPGQPPGGTVNKLV